MSLKTSTWRGRHKGISRRLRRDLRSLLPMIGMLCCFLTSATAILAAESVPLVPLQESPAIDDYFMISSSSTSKLSAEPAGIRPVLRLP